MTKDQLVTALAKHVVKSNVEWYINMCQDENITPSREEFETFGVDDETVAVIIRDLTSNISSQVVTLQKDFGLLASRENRAMIKCTVEAYHNVENYRPYSLRFKDRGNKSANVAQALKLGIKREGQWNGWFEVGGILAGTSLKEIGNKIDEWIASGYRELVIPGFDFGPKDEAIPSENVALVVWYDRADNNVGFGEAWREHTNPFTVKDTDKYTNKWLSF